MDETATPTDLMPIGRFSQLSRLSLKALRLYDALGLLPPAFVNPASSYRYYRGAQLRDARLIGLLRGPRDAPDPDCAGARAFKY